jgi:hypothetical protein
MQMGTIPIVENLLFNFNALAICMNLGNSCVLSKEGAYG